MSEFITKKEYVARRIREMIVSGEIRAGARIRQKDIAEQLGVSATPVREALRQLETEGYLRSTPHVGVHVSDVNREGLDEVYEIRALLEGRLARLAAENIDDESARELQQLAEEFRKATREGRLVDARRMNYRLHRQIWEFAQQPFTLEIVNALWAKFPWDTLDYVPGRDRRSVHEHKTLVDALAAHDGERAERALWQHIQSGRSDYLTSQKKRKAADDAASEAATAAIA